MDWIAGNLMFVGPAIVLVLALYFGPLPVVVRGVMRKTVGRAYIRRWASPASFGLAVGMFFYVLVVNMADESRTLNAALMCFLLLLAVIDLQWRWLPIEWTLSVIVLALLNGLIMNDLEAVLIQMVVPSVAILLLRRAISSARRKEALGLGDIWLVAGLGGFLPIFGTFILIGLAALSGLFELIMRRMLAPDRREITSVSYGTHLCFVFLILTNFPQVIST